MFGLGRSSAKAIVRRYIACLNARDLAGVSALLHPDCRLIDSHGQWIEGRAAIIAATERFFAIEPAFKMTVHAIVEHDGEILLRGETAATQEIFRQDALWRARVVEGRVISWQSFGPNGSPHLAQLLRGETDIG